MDDWNMKKKTVRKLLVIARGYVHVYSHSSQSFSWLIGESPCLMPPKNNVFSLSGRKIPPFEHAPRFFVVKSLCLMQKYIYIFFKSLKSQKIHMKFSLESLFYPLVNPLDPYVFGTFF